MTHTPHDALVHAIFGQPMHAADELRAVLPSEILAELDLATLAPIDTSFIDEELRSSSADLLFSVARRGSAAGLVYVLFEHQSTLDERMPLRLLQYQTRIWERFAKEHSDSAVDVDERCRVAFGKHLLAFDFVLDDLARLGDEQILSRGVDAIVRLTLLALRNGRSHPRLHELMAGAMRALREGLRRPDVHPALEMLECHALELYDSSSAAVIHAAFESALAPDPWSETMPSAAGVLRPEGRRATLLELLEAKFGSVDSGARARLEAASIEQLVAWTRRSVFVETIEELFAG